MFIVELTKEGCASDGHNNLPDIGNIRIDLKCYEALFEAVTFLFYQEIDAGIKRDRFRYLMTDF
jgi:hypothetical protein